MNLLKFTKHHKKLQYAISLLLIVLTATACFFTAHIIGYTTVALILLLVVSLNAILFSINPVLVSALFSALIWNFFFIPPTFTFHIGTPEDVLMFLMYFVIASINAVLTSKIKSAERVARDKEEKANTIHLYNTLLNSLSHELKTPVSTIIASVDTLKENKVSYTTQNELLSQIDTAAIRLNQQVENLLNMSRVESGMLKLNFDWCDVNELLNKVTQKLSTSFKTHHIYFTANEQMPLVKLDAGLMQQVFYNIIHNACLYTPDGSTINITATYQSEFCIITIQDNGLGIAEDKLPFIFDKFYRLPNSKTGGSGLGLSIAKGFVEAHNGKIMAENKKDGGAMFTISISAEASFINHLKND